MTPASSPTRSQWERIYDDPSYQAAMKRRGWFIACSVIFFVVYYFALIILVGYAPNLMETKVAGSINIAYLFALSQFIVGWLMMWLYIRRAAQYDEENRELIAASHTKEANAS